MNTILTPLVSHRRSHRLLITLCAITLLLAPAAALAKIDAITTLSGKTYRQCSIVRVYPDGVSFTHAKGAAKVLFTDLPSSWRSRLGYDPKKAAAYQRDVEVRRAKEADARAAFQQQRARALAAAQEAEAARARLAETQALAALRAQELNQQAALAAGGPALAVAPATVPVLPALGAVYDGRDYRWSSRRRGYHYHPFGYPWSHGYSYGYPYPYGYGNGIWYGASSGYYPLNFQSNFGPGWSVYPAPPARISARRGSFSFQVNP
jgi:hypothetical protein